MTKQRMIGIVGGMGPYAGTDLANKVFAQTRAARDQEHLPLAMLSAPHLISDRTGYLLGHSRRNPAAAIFGVVRELERMGATVIGVPCNTAHAPAIWGPLVNRLRHAGSNVGRLTVRGAGPRVGGPTQGPVRLLNMIEEVARHIRLRHPRVRRVGLLATTGTCRCRVYEEVLGPVGLEVLQLPAREQEALVQRAIYDKRFGIKAAIPVSAEAKRRLRKAMNSLLAGGAEAIILGCTELPLAYGGLLYRGRPVIDTTLVLARALVREAAPRRLRPWKGGG